ncbi:hypothetical protein [Citrobacter sp. Cb127]|uniref:hypothetical protein n=1 Tax=Citrobacter sp. Cb127 TaxID=2985032 RepID=UPI00257A5B13|nr:hypothetical protein [Citrobacter sp. Cb127]MDM3332429.1 hypothetical protein [Citrobacter sp. Cb127]
MTSREQFEKWFKSDYHPDKSGPYLKDALFLAWQSSRDAIEIQLPVKVECSPYEHYMPQYTMDAESVESAIRNAGIKIKDC